MIGMPILLQEICGPILGKYKLLTDMNVEIGTEAAQFPEKEYMNAIFFTVSWMTRLLLSLTLIKYNHHNCTL